MHQWIWQQADWPKLVWDESKLSSLLGQARFTQGKLLGVTQAFHADIQTQIGARLLTDEMITTSAIEGVQLDRESVRSSIVHRLGISNAGINASPDRYVEGLLDMMLDATEHYAEPLTLKRLYGWHAALFPTGYSGMKKINVGRLRGEGLMQIVSGRADKPTLHYVAPPREGLEKQIKCYLEWFNGKRKVMAVTHQVDGLIRAAIAHLWFEILHPFDDGNGRLGRAIVDMALAQDEQLHVRYYSLSAQIMSERKGYYAILEKTTRGDLDITSWIEWFLHCYISAIERSLEIIRVISLKNYFWQQHAETTLNERQRKVLNRMLDAGVEGFVGGMTTRKYMNLTRTSRATAYRELKDLVTKGCFEPLPGEGRSSAYQICWPEIETF